MVCIEEVGHCATIATSAKLSRNYQAKWVVIEAFQLNRGIRGDSFKKQSANITNALNFKRTYPLSLLAPFLRPLEIWLEVSLKCQRSPRPNPSSVSLR